MPLAQCILAVHSGGFLLLYRYRHQFLAVMLKCIYTNRHTNMICISFSLLGQLYLKVDMMLVQQQQQKGKEFFLFCFCFCFFVFVFCFFRVSNSIAYGIKTAKGRTCQSTVRKILPQQVFSKYCQNFNQRKHFTAKEFCHLPKIIFWYLSKIEFLLSA